MKKVTITISTILMISFLAASAYAWMWGGVHGNGYNNGAGFNNATYQSFTNDTQVLRSSIAADRAELNELMAGSNPDSKRARALSEKISRSENELRAKAQEYNVRGMGMMGMRGYNGNYMGCW
jgi:Spy/CpxP family protein refolding chaperone